jgi:hypothetical protein
MSPMFIVDGARGDAFARRSMMLAFGVGLVLALGSSGTIVLERILGNGSARFAFASSVVVAGVSSLVFSVIFRTHSAGFFFGTTVARLRAAILIVPQLLGVALGITLTHLVLQRVGTAPWLSEEPRQFVNDIVATVTIVAVMRACGARSFSFVALAVGLATVTLYVLTASSWHVDRPPRPFDVGVQQLVVVQIASAATALFVTRLAFTFAQPPNTSG